MQRVNSIYDWQFLDDGKQVVIASDVPDLRLVKLRVNAPSPAALYVKVADAEDPIFLARVEGLDEIWFHVLGDYTLLCTGSFVMFDTLDGTRSDVEPVEPESFTVIAERQAIDPVMQYMMLKTQENFERRLAQQAAAFDEAIASVEARREAERTNAEAAGGTAQEQDDGQVPPDPQVADPAGAEPGQSADE